MATRLYLWGTAQPSVKPPASALWTSSGTLNFPHARLHTVKGTSYSTAVASYSTAMVTGGDYKVQTWQTKPMHAQIVQSGPFVLYAQVRESLAAADMRSQITVRVTDISGQTTKQVLYNGDLTNVLSSEWLPSTVTRSFPRQAIAPVSLPTFTVAAGDRLVFELGARLLGPPATYTASITNSDSLTPVSPNEAVTTLGAPWVELPGTVTFIDWVTNTFPISWDIDAQVKNQFPVSWDTEAREVAEFPIYWYADKLVTIPFTLEYPIYGRVYSQYQINWDVAGKVRAEFPLLYEVDKRSTSTYQLVYEILSTRIATFSVNWEVRDTAANIFPINWTIDDPPPLAKYFGLYWYIDKRQTTTFPIDLSSRELVQNFFPLSWSSVARVLSTTGIYWYDLITDQPVEFPLYWEVRDRATRTFQLRWDSLIDVDPSLFPINWTTDAAKNTVVQTYPVYWYDLHREIATFDIEWDQDDPEFLRGLVRLFRISWPVATVLPPAPPEEDPDVIHVNIPSSSISVMVYPTSDVSARC